MSPKYIHSRKLSWIVFSCNFFGTVLVIAWSEFWTERLKSRIEENIELRVDVARNFENNLGNTVSFTCFCPRNRLISYKSDYTLHREELYSYKSNQFRLELTGIAATNLCKRNRKEVPCFGYVTNIRRIWEGGYVSVTLLTMSVGRYSSLADKSYGVLTCVFMVGNLYYFPKADHRNNYNDATIFMIVKVVLPEVCCYQSVSSGAQVI
jgi:hypothetical protein